MTDTSASQEETLVSGAGNGYQDIDRDKIRGLVNSQDESGEPHWLSMKRAEAADAFYRLPPPELHSMKAAEFFELVSGCEARPGFSGFNHAETERLFSFAPENSLEAMHLAYLTNGYFREFHGPGPHAAELSTQGISHSIISIGENAAVYLLVRTGGASNTIEVRLAEGAKLELVSLQPGRAYARFDFHCGKDSGLRLFPCEFGELSCYRAFVNLESQGASAEIMGMVLGSGSRRADTLTKLTHEGAHTTSNTTMRGVLRDGSISHYRGFIKILKSGQKSNAFLDDHTIMVGARAQAHSIPSLEIDANDVRAGHGATIGTLDADQLFYMQARGLDYLDAVTLISEGFFHPILDKISNGKHRDAVKSVIDSDLA